MANYFKHATALVESNNIGSGTRIWANAHILPRASIGSDCNICDGVFIENKVTIGNRVTIKCGVQIWDGIILEDDVFVGPNATFTNDPFPRSKQFLTKYSETIIEAGASIGANATILPGIKIGKNAMIGAGSVITKNVPDHAIMIGNPAKISGFTNSENSEKQKSEIKPEVLKCGAILREINEQQISQYIDPLKVFQKKIEGFKVEQGLSSSNYFEEQGDEGDVVLICLNGDVNVKLNSTNTSEILTLNKKQNFLSIPKKTPFIKYNYSNNCLLLSFLCKDE